MSNAEIQREPAAAGTFDMKLEVVVIPVSDVDRAKRFYGDLGWRLDFDYAAGDDFRVIQFYRPPATNCSAAASRSASHSMTPAAYSTMPARKAESAAQIRNEKVTPHTPRSAIRMATAGCSKRSPRD